MRNRYFSLPAVAAFTLLLTLPAQAQDDSGLVKLREGQTLLNISASERREVTQDTLTASLRYEAEGKDPKALQSEINTAMKKAVELAKKVEGVKVSTDGYYVYPHDPEPPRPLPNQGAEPDSAAKPRMWRGAQELRIEGRAADRLLELAGKLQEMGLVMGGLTYSLSPEKAEEVKDSLMEAALSKLNARAKRAAKALGMTKTDLVEISVDASNNGPMPMARMAMMESSVASKSMDAPTAEPGETEITLTVSARALLKP